jgi:hypothetical protein
VESQFSSVVVFGMDHGSGDWGFPVFVGSGVVFRTLGFVFRRRFWVSVSWGSGIGGVEFRFSIVDIMGKIKYGGKQMLVLIMLDVIIMGIVWM